VKISNGKNSHQNVFTLVAEPGGGVLYLPLAGPCLIYGCSNRGASTSYENTGLVTFFLCTFFEQF
jgi:hypothetical protein